MTDTWNSKVSSAHNPNRRMAGRHSIFFLCLCVGPPAAAAPLLAVLPGGLLKGQPTALQADGAGAGLQSGCTVEHTAAGVLQTAGALGGTSLVECSFVFVRSCLQMQCKLIVLAVKVLQKVHGPAHVWCSCLASRFLGLSPVSCGCAPLLGLRSWAAGSLLSPPPRTWLEF